MEPRSESENAAAARLLATLECLMRSEAASIAEALQEGSDLLAETLRADKVDAFIYDPAGDALVALGTSHTPMGHRQKELGLNRLPLAAGGRTAWVFSARVPHRTGRADQDPWELRGVAEDLGVRSVLSTPLDVGGESHGVLQVCSTQPARFTAADLQFLTVVAHWLGLVGQRAAFVDHLHGREGSPGALLMAQKTLALQEDDLRASHAALAEMAVDPDAVWKANLLRWWIRQLEKAVQEATAMLEGVQSAFAQSQQQVRELLSAVTTLSSQHEDLQNRYLDIIQEGARVRHELEGKLRRAEAATIALEAQLRQQFVAPE